MKKNITGRLLLIVCCMLFAATKLQGQSEMNDKTLSPESFSEIVRAYHPVAKLAGITVEKAKAGVTIARGLFDPVFYSSNAQKTFDGTEYYNYNRPELTIPTWYGITLSTGLEYLSGTRTDPQETAGKSSYAGISVPLAKNLLMDKRRATLLTAKISRDASQAERRALLNDLMYEALTAYWLWVQYYENFRLLTEAVTVNTKRLELVRTAVRQGDRPAIDSTEAMTQLQQFLLQQSEAAVAFQNQGLELSTYLWNEKGDPVLLPAGVLPAVSIQRTDLLNYPVADSSRLLDSALSVHPELQQYRFKLKSLAVEKKLKFQELLPTVNFRYNQLGKDYTILKTVTGPLFENNFQYGLTLGLPLRFSQGRGEYKQARLKIMETSLQQDMKQVSILNKMRAVYNDIRALQEQDRLQSGAVRNFEALQRGEETRFMAGESSLFLVNARENKTLEARQKLAAIKTKYMQKQAALFWSAGLLQ